MLDEFIYIFPPILRQPLATAALRALVCLEEMSLVLTNDHHQPQMQNIVCTSRSLPLRNRVNPGKKGLKVAGPVACARRFLPFFPEDIRFQDIVHIISYRYISPFAIVTRASKSISEVNVDESAVKG